MGRHTSSGAPVVDLIKVTGSSILEVVFLAAVGYILARRGVIDKKTQTKINKLNVSFFTPALLFSKVAFTLNPRRLVELVIVPLGFVIITAVSALSAVGLSAAFRLTKAQRNFAIACAISPNSNSLPVALMQSLVQTVPQLHWEEEGEPEDTVNGMLGRALTYLVLYSTLGMFLRWSVGAQLLSSVDQAEAEQEQQERLGYHDEPEEDDDLHAEREDDPLLRGRQQQHTSPALHLRGSTADGGYTTTLVSPSPVRSNNSRSRSERKRTGPPAWARSFPNSPTGSRTSFSDEDEEDAHELEDEGEDAPRRSVEDPEWGETRSSAAARQAALANGGSGSSASALQSATRRVGRTCTSLVLKPLQAVFNFMTMPLWAALLSLVVALIPPLQKFIDSLEPVVGALETAGACSIPLTMVVLGAYFHEETDPNAAQAGAQTAGSPAKSHGQPPAPLTQAATSKPTNGQHPPPQVEDPWRVASADSSGTLSSSTAVEEHDGSAAGGERRPPSRMSWVYNPWASGSVGSVRGSSGGSTAAGPPSSTGSVAALAPAPSTPTTRAAKAAAAKRAQERRTIFVSICSRMVLTPLILVPALAWYAIATRYNVVDDPVFITSAVLLIGSPPALTLAQITSQNASEGGGFERLISRTIFVAYAILAAPTTIALVMTALLIAEKDHM